MFRILTLWLGLDHFVELLRAIYTNMHDGGDKRVHSVLYKSAGVVGSAAWKAHGFSTCMVFDTACRFFHKKLISELGDGFGLDLEYNIPIQATNGA